MRKHFAEVRQEIKMVQLEFEFTKKDVGILGKKHTIDMPGLIRIIEKYKDEMLRMVEEREQRLTTQYAKVDENYFTIKAAAGEIINKYENCAEVM